MQVDTPLVLWIMDYLRERLQYGHRAVFLIVLCSTEAQQGTDLSPFLSTLYITNFTYNTEGSHLQKN